ncbi:MULTISPECIES: hypothetical protein [Actinomadura]|uniref:hypothetical protein n=1 Tax=Actinomadura TaxID=1988 RepID=UPI001267A0CC|nr:hypothetical protein [Actinomadura madurae]
MNEIEPSAHRLVDQVQRIKDVIREATTWANQVRHGELPPPDPQETHRIVFMLDACVGWLGGPILDAVASQMPEPHQGRAKDLVDELRKISDKIDELAVGLKTELGQSGSSGAPSPPGNVASP